MPKGPTELTHEEENDRGPYRPTRILPLKLVADIQAKIKQLEAEKKSEDEFVKYAWNAYGSELAGDLCDKSNALAEKICLLQSVLSGKMDLSREAEFRATIRDTADLIAKLQKQQTELENSLTRIEKAKDLLKIPIS